MIARRQIVVIAVLALAAAGWGTWYASRANTLGARFTLFDFAYGPAVMTACGREYASPRPGAVPALDAFLATRADRFDCASLPAAVPAIPLTGFQRTFKYLMWTMALVWKATGVSWSALSILSGALLAFTVVATVLLLRVVAPLWLAVIGGVLIMTSPLQLAYLSDFRNYPKAPLSIGLAVLMSRAVQGGTSRHSAAMAAAAGVLLGIGLGFRQDLMIFAPLCVVAILVTGAIKTLRWKVAAIGAFAAGALIGVGPQLSAYTSAGGGASVGHVATLGLMSPFDGPLGVTNDGLYEWGYYNEDSFAYATIAGHGRRFLGVENAIPVYGADYDRSATSYWGEVLKTFPADFLVRGYASAWRLVELPSSTAATQVPAVLVNGPLEWAWRMRAAALQLLSGWWVALTVVALVLVSVGSIPWALSIAAIVIYVLAYPAIQFHERHFFYLEIVPMLAAAFVVTTLADWRALPRTWPAFGPPARRIATFTAIVVVGVAAPAAAARAMQTASVRALLDRYANAERRPMAFDESSNGDRISLHRLDAPALPPPGTTETELLAIGLGGAGCGSIGIDLSVRYKTSHITPDFSRTVHVPLAFPPSLTRVFVPVLAHRSEPAPDDPEVSYRFDGIEVPAAQRPCITDLATVADIHSLPVLVGARLAQEWQRQEPYQTLIDWEGRTRVVPTVVTTPSPIGLENRLGGHAESWPLADRSPSQVEVAGIVAIDATGRWRIDGRGGLGGNGRMFYLAQLRGAALKGGELLLAEGSIESGGLSIGLLQDGRWSRQAAIATRGPFLAVVEVPADGTYDVVVANNLQQRFAANHFTLSKIGLLK